MDTWCAFGELDSIVSTAGVFVRQSTSGAQSADGDGGNSGQSRSCIFECMFHNEFLGFEVQLMRQRNSTLHGSFLAAVGVCGQKRGLEPDVRDLGHADCLASALVGQN